MVFVYAITLFWSAFLLFSVQPLVGKMILPLLGGTPAVWNTCLVFFQITLLVGYLYAHAVGNYLRHYWQQIVHLTLLAIVIFMLPISLPEGIATRVPTDSNPWFWLMAQLALMVSFPVFLLSTSSPLLQKWFASTTHPDAQDPYYLFAASNWGSMAGLLAYPFVIEPNWDLIVQNRLWQGAYYLLILLILSCVFCVFRFGSKESKPINDSAPPPKMKRYVYWIVLTFAPSSLLLGVTQYLTTNIAAIPLLWVIPLALYLLTYSLAFSNRWRLRSTHSGRVMGLLALPLIIAILLESSHPAWLILPLHLLFFFISSWNAHSVLANDRPTPRYLTQYFLCISIGGILGGMFNSLVAPLLFNSVMEYPLVICLACGLQAGASLSGFWQKYRRPAWIFMVAGITILLAHLFEWGSNKLITLSIFLPSALLCYRLVRQPVSYALGLFAIVSAGKLYTNKQDGILFAERNFFGIVRVGLNAEEDYRILMHGDTIHGRQAVDREERREPASYYHKLGPMGQVFEEFGSSNAVNDVAIIGLGIGGLAAYAQPWQNWTYFEINPIIRDVATNSEYFTYLRDTQARNQRIVLGDARIKLAEYPEGVFDLMIMDAFSSDSIPVHLITKEALALYESKLRTGGLILFNISNRFLEVSGVLANLAADAGLICLRRRDVEEAKVRPRGKDNSQWIVLGRAGSPIETLSLDSRWEPLSADPQAPFWTDRFSSLFEVIAFR